MPRTFALRGGKNPFARRHFAAAAAIVAAFWLALGFAPFRQQAARAQLKTGTPRLLSTDERIKYQRAIEEVYWRHTIWPAENASPKPALDEVSTREQTASKVEDVLRKSQALAQRWGRPVTAEQLQAEMTRMTRETKQPEVLRELFGALDNDPFVIAEVLARPALVERLARSSFSAGAKSDAPQAGFDSWWAGAGSEFGGGAVSASGFQYRLGEINQAAAGADDTWKPTQVLPVGNGTAVWTGTEVIVWGGQTSLGGRTNTGSRYNPATDTWISTSTVGAPDGRIGHTAVWTGTEMLVWGGSNGVSAVNTGGRYNPSTDTWTPTSTVGVTTRSGHTSVWTGSKMIFWGGCTRVGSDICRIGGVYDPASDTWKTTSLTNAPTNRVGHRAVWTGTEMIVWGGSNASAANTGGRYNPDTDTWTPTNTFNAPGARSGFTMVWTGTEAIVWGGYEGNFVTINSGGRYNPSTDSWTPTSTANAPGARFGHTAVWTGTEMIVYGGDLRPAGNQDQITNTGGRYDPAKDVWTPTSATNAPNKDNHVAVWTGAEMFVWGGRHATATVFKEGARYDPSKDTWTPTNKDDSVPSVALGVWSGAELLVWGRDPNCISGCASAGGRYDPATNLWRPISVNGAPSGDSADGATAVWTGREMIVWGAMNADGAGRYNPLTDTWTRTSAAGAPEGKMYSTAVWTGTEMLVWGGDNNADNAPSAGGRYNPSTDTWRLMTMVAAPAARRLHSAVWTGTEMVVWGGSQFGGAPLDTGGRYNPSTDSWTPTSAAGAPAARYGNTAVWTGTEMIIWGGRTGEANSNTGLLGTGGRYNPSTDSWTPTSAAGAPAARADHRAVWTGSNMIVWGGGVAGVAGPAPTYTGARYNPASDVWTPTSTQSAPGSRRSHVQVWTGTQMIVWGGINGESALTSDGGVYNAPGASAGNTPPTVRLTSPAQNAAFKAGNDIQLDAEVSDSDGAVTSVSFYANDTLIGTDNAAPFGFTWNKVRSGSYALTAAATDDAGGVTRSAPVNVNVEALIGPPNAVITSPADGAAFESTATIHVAADVQPNPDRDITKVEFYLSEGQGAQTLVNTDTTAPYGFDLANQPAGSYVVYAFAYDGEDVGISPGARFSVGGPPRPFNISGQVTDSRGVAIVGIAVKLAGTDAATATTNANGFYFFGSLAQGGNYTVTPSAANYSYAPPSLTFNNLAGTQSDANFVATASGHDISGRLTHKDGSPVFPATVNLSGSKVATTGTDVNGNYFFRNLAAGGTYTVQPFKNLYTFEPGFRTYQNLSAEQSADFVGTPQSTTFTVGGRVVDVSGAPVAGLRVRLDTTRVTGTQFRTTDAAGVFSFGNIEEGETCRVWPEDFTYAYDFAPASRVYTSLGQNVSDADFVATPRAVTGRITQAGSGLAGVTVTLDGPQTGTATTGDDGAFAFRGVTLRGDYTVSASRPGYAFTPTAYALKDLKEDVTANFEGAALATPTPTPTPTPSPTPEATPTPVPTPLPVEPARFVLAGNLTFEEQNATGTLTVRRTGDAAQPATVDYATADGTARQGYDYMTASGTLRFAAGETEKQLTLILIDDGYDEADETFTIALSSPTGGAQLGSPSAAQVVIHGGEASAARNPSDDAGFFVRQHYADFLGRVPDDAGLDFWAGQIARCGTDAACVERQRVNVSAAFFLSIEFQETGYLVYRLQKATDGRVPRYADFMRQAQDVGSGVVVNALGWQEKLESNKRDFVERWTQSDAFRARYDSMSDERYVDALISNTGVELGVEFRDALVRALGDKSETRAGALRRVAEHDSVRRAELNRAFVLMQYFGYLRRNPDDAPDSNLDGYNFWLQKLDGFGGDFRRAEMVKAFISSTEYRQRFGQ